MRFAAFGVTARFTKSASLRPWRRFLQHRHARRSSDLSIGTGRHSAGAKEKKYEGEKKRQTMDQMEHRGKRTRALSATSERSWRPAGRLG